MPNPLSLVTRQRKKPLTGVAGPGMHWAGPSGGGVGGERPSEQEKKKAAAMSFRHRRRARGQGGGEARPAPPTPPSLSLTHRVERGRARPDGADRQGGSEQDLGEHRGRAREPGGKKKKRVRRGGGAASARRPSQERLCCSRSHSLLPPRPPHSQGEQPARARSRPACQPLPPPALSLVASSPSGIEERERGEGVAPRHGAAQALGGGRAGAPRRRQFGFSKGGGKRARSRPPPAAVSAPTHTRQACGCLLRKDLVEG